MITPFHESYFCNLKIEVNNKFQFFILKILKYWYCKRKLGREKLVF
jgi:hypothetical protein